MAEVQPNVDREQLLTILKQWDEGSLTEAQVQEFAESITNEYDLPELPHDEDQSIPVEVLFHLDALPGLLVSKQDIPVMIAFLHTPSGQAESGWEAWLAYWGAE
jgi:hypothetical protein